MQNIILKQLNYTTIENITRIILASVIIAIQLHAVTDEYYFSHN